LKVASATALQNSKMFQCGFVNINLRSKKSCKNKARLHQVAQ